MPWKLGNPFSNSREEPSGEEYKATVVEVRCEGCARNNKTTVINLRVEKKDNGRKRKNCRNCNTTAIEVEVDSKGGVTVYQTVGMESRVKTKYEKIWQEGDRA